MNTKRIHLEAENGIRWRCRYTSRPGHTAVVAALHQFLAIPKDQRCKQCQAYVVDEQLRQANIRSKRESLPRYGQIWNYRGAKVCILGNSIGEDGRVWSADWETGLRVDALVVDLAPLEITATSTFDLVVSKCCEWAKSGNADAAWWLGWRFEGTNHPKSIWYYVVALRADPKGYGWALDNIISNAAYGSMCAGTPQPNISYLAAIPEFKGRIISSDWASAVRSAEVAEHQPASASQLESALHYMNSGMSSQASAFKAGVTQQFLNSSTECRVWREAKWPDISTEQSESTAATVYEKVSDEDELPF